jgi:hypothetical protein
VGNLLGPRAILFFGLEAGDADTKSNAGLLALQFGSAQEGTTEARFPA